MDRPLEHTEAINNSPVRTFGSILDEIKRKFSTGELERPINLGYSSLAKVLKGIRRNEVIVLAGRPSIGKTAVALNYCINLLKIGKKVLVFDLEEQEQENILRMINILSGYQLKQKLEDEFLTDKEKQELFKAIDKGYELIKDKGLFYVSKPGLSLEDMKEIAESYKDVDLVVIDYLQKVKGKGSNNYEKVTDVASNLRKFSSDLEGVPLLVLAQINRAAIDNNDNRPQLWNLKGSGEIEENADVVILLHREGYYNHDDRPAEEAMELIIDKNRHGATGSTELWWNAPLFTLSEINQ